MLAPSFSPLPSFARARACSPTCTRSLTRAVLSLAHARCALARAFSRCCSREFWEAQLSYGTKRASDSLARSCVLLSLVSLNVAALSHTCAFSRSRALAFSRTLRSRSLSHDALSRLLCSRSLVCAALHDMLFSPSITML